ncbi:MAG: TetR family transcriptional regulator [Propionibacteriales bacterium]|nr:TetR family transcriptional regulator [Propionibacteriales bacterium]
MTTVVGRRAPKAGERLRDAERTRERILDAALIEFGAHGFTGARISAIADRAGVNKQLISYYFGGKQGLYDELADRFRRGALDQAATEMSADHVVAEFVRSTLHNRDWARLMAWEQLEDRGRSPVDPAQREFMRSQVRYVTARQERGELPADIDPSYLLLALITAASASVVLPNLARGIVDEDPESPEFHQRYAEELAKLVRHLRP